MDDRLSSKGNYTIEFNTNDQLRMITAIVTFAFYFNWLSTSMSQITCPQCGKLAAVTPKLQGRKVKCTCGTILRMPGDKVEVTGGSTSAPARPTETTAKHVSSPTVQKKEVMCPHCFATYMIAENLFGKTIKGPCGHTFLAQPTVLESNETDGYPQGHPGGFDDLVSLPTNFQTSAPTAAGNPYGTPTNLPAYLWPGGIESTSAAKVKVEYRNVKNSSAYAGESDSNPLNSILGVLLILAGLECFGYVAYAFYELHIGTIQGVRWRGVIGWIIFGCALIGGGVRMNMGIEDDKES